MKRLIHLSFSYTRYVIALLVLLSGYSALGQTPGLILKPATGAGAAIMDPDGDGYVSQKTAGQQLGFRTNDVAESEIPFVAIVRPDPLGDILRGPEGGFTEIVGTDAAGNNAILTYTDGTNLCFRFRLSSYAPNSKSYSLLVDTDQRFGFNGTNADPNARPGNAGFEVEIVLKTNFSVDVYDIDGKITGVPLVTEGTFSYETHCQKSIALSTAGTPADPDYFYDFYVPFSSLPFNSLNPVRYVALTGMSPSPAIGSSSSSDVGGVTVDGISLDQAFNQLIEEQTPTLPGQEVLERSACPSISGSISSGATSVSGSTTEAAGTIIRLYVNDVQVGNTTTGAGGAWNITGLSPLTAGATVKATAQAPGKGESASTCNLSFVGTSCTTPPVFVSLMSANKGVNFNVTGPVGTIVTLYGPNSDNETAIYKNGVPEDNNPVTTTVNNQTGLQITGTTGQALEPGSYYLVAYAPGQCNSQRTYFGVSCITTTTTPVISSTTPLSSFITGTGGVSGAIMYIYANGSLIGSKTLTADGAWSVPVQSSMICNTTLTAQQASPTSCISALSAAVSVGLAVTSAPTIIVDKCSSSLTVVKGYSGESNGTTIEVFVNGVSRGTTTVSGGLWSLNVSSAVTTGQTITARATNSLGCKTVSALSASVTLTGTTTLVGTFSIGSVVAEEATSVPVTVTGLSGSYTLNLYIDGDKIGSTNITGNGTYNVPVTYASDIYTGGKLQVSLTQGAQCESSLSGYLTTVSCNTPVFTGSVISAAQTDKCVTTSGSIILTNSQTLVIYTPVDQDGLVKGYSTLGTGGTISLNTFAFPSSGSAPYYIKAQRIVASGTCEAISSGSVTFNAYSAPQFTTHPASKIVCSGESTTLTASWSGIGPYNVQWQYNNGGGFINLTDGSIYSQTSTSGGTSATATLNIGNVSGLDNISYRCIITDLGVPTDCQVSTSNSATLTVAMIAISNVILSNATTGNNGSINITVTGGNEPYTFDWHHLNGSGTFGELKDLTGLAGGNYTVTVKDANNCTHQQTFTVGGIGSINLTYNSQVNVSCFGANNGQFTVTASSGTGPYSYSIDNFATPQATGNFTNLGPGIYTVKARDSQSAESNSVSVTITEPLEMVVYATVSNPSVSLNDGSIHVTVIGGTATFNYTLSQGGTSIQTLTNESNDVSFLNLSGGTYSIQVTDANSCIALKSNVVLVNPQVTVISCTHDAAHSFNSKGSESPSYSHYDGEYDYFSNNPWIENSDDNNRIQLNKQALGFGLIPADTQSGNQAVILSGNPSISRKVDLTGVDLSSVKIAYKFSVDVPSGNDNYGVRLFVNNATTPAAFHVQNSDQGINGSVNLTSASANVTLVNGLNTFRFELYRVSSNKYEAESNLLIDDFSVSFKKSMNVGVIASQSTCDNGKIDLSVSGGYPPYIYSWSKVGTPAFVSTIEDPANLSPGTYRVIVSDSRGCSSPVEAIVTSASLSASVTNSANPTCVGGGSNGSVTATISPTALGNGGPYTYELINGASEIISTVVSASTSKTFTGLTAGTYSIKVTQAAEGCFTQTLPVTLTLPEFSSDIVFIGGSSTICSGTSTSIAVNITNGTAPYTVLLSNGQSIVNYTPGASILVSPVVSTTYTVLSVTDAASCVSISNTGSVAVTVNPVLPVSVSISANPSNTVCAGTSVTFTASPSNAGANPTYTWKVGSQTVGANSASFTTSSLLNGDVVTCIVTKDPAEACNTGSPATSNALVMGVRTSSTVNAGNNILTCSTYGAVNITAGATASNYSSVIWTSNGTGTFTNANSLSLASYSPSSNDIAIGTVTLTLTAFANAPCNNAVSTKTLTITSGQTADFSYPDSPYCSNEANPLPVFSEGAIGGIFSSTPGLVFISTSTGQINLSASTPGNYTITNTIAASGGCGVATATYDITIFQDGSWTGAINQDWNNAGNWACNQIPTIVTNVFIANGLPNYPLLSTGASGKAYHITIEDEASVTVSGNTLQIAGDISNAGTFTATEGTIEMKGSVAQSISANVFSTNTLMNLIINNAAGVTLGGALNITGIVTPALGNFNSAGYLTLVSTVSQTALIEGTGSGSITGNVNMQRYLPSSFGYKYFSSPFQGATVAELADEVNLTETFPTFYTYDENHSRDSLGHTVYYSGWTKYTETTNALIPMAGYAANMGTGTLPVTVTMSGVVNNGTISTTLYNRNRKYTKGFNLVGNPYPSPIDWNAGGWTKTNIDNALYFFNAGNTDRYTGIYSSYVNGVSTGNATNIIAAMQGFFVHVTDPVSVSDYPVSATLGTTNSVRINNLNPVFKSASIDPRPAIRLSAGFELNHAIEDAAVVYFDPTASVRFDKEKDALKLKNTDEQVPNIYTLADGHKLSINGLSEPSDSVSFIPIGLTTYRDGWINLRAENADELPFMQVYLSDAETGKYHDLIRSPEVRFYLPRGICESRFKLVFSKAPFTGEYPVAERLFKLIRTDNQVMIKVNLPLGTKGNLMVTDVLGQSLLRKEVSGKETVSIGQKSVTGVYVITLVSGRRTESEKILMRQDYE